MSLLESMFISVGELLSKHLEPGTHIETFKTLLSSALPTPSSHTPSTEESVGSLPGASKGPPPRPTLKYDSSRSPFTGWPRHRKQQPASQDFIVKSLLSC